MFDLQDHLDLSRIRGKTEITLVGERRVELADLIRELDRKHPVPAPKDVGPLSYRPYEYD